MSNETELDIVEEFETFLYTPYGMSALAGLAILLTSALWGVGCCLCFCCYRRRLDRSSGQDGTLEANREMEYYGMLSSSSSSGHHRGNGTMSSGYSTGPTAYSLSLADNHTVTSSLDSIVDSQ